MAYWAAAKWGSDTPAWAQAHIVRPEQSKATPGEAAAKRYGTPSWLSAARTAVAAPGEVAGTSTAGGSSFLAGACVVLGLSTLPGSTLVASRAAGACVVGGAVDPGVCGRAAGTAAAVDRAA